MIVLASVVAQCILLVYGGLAYHNCKCHTGKNKNLMLSAFRLFLHGIRSCSHMFLSLPHPFMRWLFLTSEMQIIYLFGTWFCSVSHGTHESEILCGTLI